MHASRGVGWVCLLGSFFCVGSAAADAPPGRSGPEGGGESARAGSDAATQARKLYEKSRGEAAAGNWESAYATLRAAYAWYPHSQIAGALGDAAFVLGKYPEAAEMLTRYLDQTTNLAGKALSDAEKRLAEARKKCGKIAIDGPDGAEVRIDTAPIGKLPLQKALYVLPGSHTVEVVSPGGTVKQTVDVAAGKSVRVDTPGAAAVPAGVAGATPGTATVATPDTRANGTVAEAGTPATSVRVAGTAAPGAPQGVMRAPGPTATQAAAETTKPSYAPALVMGAAAGVGALVGGALMIASVAKEGEAADALKPLANAKRPCTSAPCLRVDHLLADRDAYGSAALGVWIGSMVLGAAALATGVYIARSRNKTDTAITWAPTASPAGGGLVVVGSF